MAPKFLLSESKAMPPTTVKNQKSKLEEGDKFHLGYHEFEVTEITQHAVGQISPEYKREVWIEI